MSTSTYSRRDVLRTALAAGGALCAPSVFAQASNWPSKSVAIVVGYPPGGQTDFVARVLSQGMQEAFGQPVIIDNKPGVNGNIAATNVLQAAPDGYRLLAGNGIMTIAPHTYRRIQIADPLAFTPIGTMLTSGLALLVPAASPVQTYQDFVQYARSAPGGIDYATSGAGGLTHVTTELWRERIGGPTMNHIPYKGGGPAAIALIGAQVAGMFEAVSVVSPFIKSGQVRALMVTTPERVSMLPEVPTIRESTDWTDADVVSTFGVLAPQGTPREVVERLNREIGALLQKPEVRQQFLAQGVYALDAQTLTQAQARLKAEVARWESVIRDAGIQTEN